MYSSNAKEGMAASDAFEEEKAKELKTSSLARKWEAGRKKDWQRNKHEWREKRISKEIEPIKRMVDTLKDGGKYEVGILPAPGYILIETEKKEEMTPSGIYLPDEVDTNSLVVGFVIAIGGGKLLDSGKEVTPPAQVGDKVLFKRGAGLDMTIKDQNCKFMQFSDVLGVFTE